MNMKHLNHAGIAGLFLVAFASAAFAETEQLRRNSSRFNSSNASRSRTVNTCRLIKGYNNANMNRTMTEEQERLRQQQQMQQHQQMQERLSRKV